MAAPSLANNNGAFIDPEVRVTGSQEGPLRNLTFAAKDIYDVEGRPTGHGNPTWQSTHPPATVTAPVIQALLEAGATLTGKTHMDELAYSLNGENVHYGTPTNPACPDRIPGGSSSGSAVAVADGSVAFALGSDTGGSVRVPSSYCGILGIRPTHGRVSLTNACPLAPSLDTGGWFAREADLLASVGKVILDPASRVPTTFSRMLLATDALECAEPSVAAAIHQLIRQHHSELASAAGTPAGVILASLQGRGNLSDWYEVFRVVQAAEAWQALGPWIESANPDFGPGIRERFAAAAKITAEQAEAAASARESIRAHVEALIGSNAVLVLPSAPGPAIKLRTPAAQLDGFRTKLLCLTSPSGLSGLPQVSLPLLTVEGCPVGIGLIGPRGSDEDLLALCAQLYPALRD